MSNTITQQQRLLQLITPLGDDSLILTELQGEECLSTNFCYNLTMFSSDTNIQAHTLIGKVVTAIINQDPNNPRYINGIIKQFQASNLKQRGMREYQAQIVPWLWFLTQTTDCRIFQNNTTPEIIKTIFKEYNFHDYDMSKIMATHNKREYCVQYSETIFDFISRLMEEEGIFYYFKHQQDKHTLVLSDKSSSCQVCATNITFNSNLTNQAQLTDWQHTYNFYPSKISTTDYNFLTPNNKLLTNQTAASPLASSEKYSHFYYPGNYNDIDSGKT